MGVKIHRMAPSAPIQRSRVTGIGFHVPPRVVTNADLEQVMDTTDRAKQVVQELFSAYLDEPGQMSEGFAEAVNRHRAVADYIAGMTDRFAIREHARLTGRHLFD